MSKIIVCGREDCKFLNTIHQQCCLKIIGLDKEGKCVHYSPAQKYIPRPLGFDPEEDLGR